MSDEYRNHHYVAQWYQKRFLLPGKHELYCLNLKPDTITISPTVSYTKKALKKQCPLKCFVERDLYTTKINGMVTTDIEQSFFGDIDTKGLPAVEYFTGFSYPLKTWGTSLEDLLLYMSTQKLRTPK